MVLLWPLQLGPLLPNIFMSSLDEEVLPTLSSCLCNWKRYVDENNAFIVSEKVLFILNKLNSTYPNIQFTFE